MPKTLNLNEAQQEFIDRNLIPLFDEYKNTSEKLLAKTKEGYLVKTNINILKSGSMPNIFSKHNPYTIQNIKLWCKLNNKCFALVSDEYKGDNGKLQWQCLKDGCREVFETSWAIIQSNCGCPYCSGQKVGLSNCLATKNPELAKQWHPYKNDSLTPYDVTCSCNKKVWWKCDKGHEWKAIINSRNKGYNCPYCAEFYPSENYNLLFYNPELCEEWDYSKNDKQPEEYTPNSNKKVYWICKKCGYEWASQISNRSRLKNGCGCPQCNNSKGEKQLDYILTNYNIHHDSQYIFDNLFGIGGGLLKFDVSIFWDINKINLRCLIEYDGEYHYKPIKQYKNEPIKYAEERLKKQQIHDKLKDEYTKNNNIKLIRIPYWEFDNIETILKNELRLA